MPIRLPKSRALSNQARAREDTERAERLARILRAARGIDEARRSRPPRKRVAELTVLLLRELIMDCNESGRELRPPAWNPYITPERFAGCAGAVAELLDREVWLRTRGRRHLVPFGRASRNYDVSSEPDIRDSLCKLFSSWVRLEVRLEDGVDNEDFVFLAKRMLRRLGAPNGAVQDAFRVGWHCETMKERRKAKRHEIAGETAQAR